MKFRIIASGSRGNMTYIETEQAKILIDAGISLKEAEKRSDIDFSNLDAILITHEHGDHVGFLKTIASKTNAIVYIQKDTLATVVRRNKYDMNLRVKYIEPNQTYAIKDLKFYTLNLSHDVLCLGFIFNNNGRSLGYITDTGFIQLPYINLLKKVDALIIEANHDIEMLYNSDRHWALKQRIYSVKGHMSNYICGQILNTIIQEKRLQQVVLAHLSDECNTEEIAVDTILELINGEYIPKLFIAKQNIALDFIEV